MSFKSSVLAALAFGATALISHAAPRSFDFKDPKGVNNVQFTLDAPLESITGGGNGISGEVVFDPAAPAATRGVITVQAGSLTVGNPVMREHLHSPNWLDVAKHPTISFEPVSFANVRTEGARTLADVSGKLTLKGITRDVTLPVSLTYLPGKLGARLGDEKIKGDLLVLRAEFTINRGEFEIMAGQATDKVADTIHLSLSIAGSAPTA